MTMTVATPTRYGDPFVITLAAIPAATPVVTLWRAPASGAAAELVQGTPLVLSGGGAGTIVDALYPLAGPFTYELFDAAGATRLDTAGPFNPPQPAGDDAGKPQLIDVTRSVLRSAVEVIDVTTRVRRARVSVYETIGEQSYSTVGDVRLLSSGTLSVLFRSHASRDQVLAAVSTGGPVVMRVPSGCQLKLDEMWFTPQDVAEERFGKTGAGVLSIDFTEVAATTGRPLPPSVHVLTYAEQTANAATAAQTYASQSLAFFGATYLTMSLSRTGVAP